MFFSCLRLVFISRFSRCKRPISSLHVTLLMRTCRSQSSLAGRQREDPSVTYKHKLRCHLFILFEATSMTSRMRTPTARLILRFDPVYITGRDHPDKRLNTSQNPATSDAHVSDRWEYRKSTSTHETARRQRMTTIIRGIVASQPATSLCTGVTRLRMRTA